MRFIEAPGNESFLNMQYVSSARIERLTKDEDGNLVPPKEWFYYVRVKMSDGESIELFPSDDGKLGECVKWCRYVFNTMEVK